MTAETGYVPLTRDERNAVTIIMEREHQNTPMGCTCGAQVGDSIDRRWHLMNQTIAAVDQVLAMRNPPDPLACPPDGGCGGCGNWPEHCVCPPSERTTPPASTDGGEW